jgi:tyrosyl-tRNA synthetase
MLSAESVQIRLEKGLSFIEFNYQILQAYDFRLLHQRYGCTLQMGGADQWGNIVAGIELGRRMDGAQLYGLTAPLIMTAGGEKMGKSARGAVWLSSEMLAAFDFYQYWLNVHDDDVERFGALFTFLPMDEVRRLGALEGAEKREAKKILAAEVTRIVHGDAGLAEAQAATAATFGGGGSADGVPVHSVPRGDLDAGLPAFVLFADAGLAKSRGAARRLLSQGGGYCNGQRITAFDQPIDAAQLQDGRIELRAGKKSFVHVVVDG